MSVSADILGELMGGIGRGSVEVVDLTAPLSDHTPIPCPPPFANTQSFALQEISNYDARGPAWYWNNIATGEHVGTHFDAPVHWVSGRDGLDVSQVPPRQLIAPVAVIDKSAEAQANPDFLLEVEDVEAWQQQHGRLPAGGWLLFRSGWDSRAGDQATFLNANESGSHTPGPRSSWLDGWPTRRRSLASAWRPSAPTGAAHGFDPPFPCHSFMLGAGKYGPHPTGQPEQSCRRRAPCSSRRRCQSCAAPRLARARARARGAEASSVLVAEAVRRTLAALGPRDVFGLIGSGNFAVSNAMVAAARGSSPRATRGWHDLDG
jgi:kynurenine formamidase